MTLREREIAQSKRAQDSHQKQTKPKKRRKRPNEPLSHLLPEQVLTVSEWRSINRLSERNARRILADPEKRPKLVQLSPRRYGVRVADNKAWQESRSR